MTRDEKEVLRVFMSLLLGRPSTRGLPKSELHRGLPGMHQEKFNGLLRSLCDQGYIFEDVILDHNQQPADTEYFMELPGLQACRKMLEDRRKPQ